MSQSALQPELQNSGVGQGRWMVVIFNNDHNTVEEVILTLMAATKCTVEEAEIETWEAHTYGKAPVHFAGREECTDAAALISGIGVRTHVCREWDD